MTTETLTDYDLHNLRHMLGMEYNPKKVHGYRNHFCSADQGRQIESMRRLEALGLVVETGAGNETVSFRATVAGCKAAGLHEAGIKRAMEP